MPAGGAALAYTLGLAIGLLHKVVLLEIARTDREPGMETNLRVTKREIDRLLHAAERLVAEDVTAWQNYAEARETGDIASKKTGFSQILDVSMAVLEKSDAGLEWIRQLAPIVHTPLRTHLLVTGELLLGVVNGTAHLIAANIQPLRDPEKRKRYHRRTETIREAFTRRYLEITATLIETQHDSSPPEVRSPAHE